MHIPEQNTNKKVHIKQITYNNSQPKHLLTLS